MREYEHEEEESGIHCIAVSVCFGCACLVRANYFSFRDLCENVFLVRDKFHLQCVLVVFTVV